MNINAKHAATVLKRLCCLLMKRIQNVLNASAGMSKSSCRRVVCGPRELPPGPAASAVRPASLPAEGSSLTALRSGEKNQISIGYCRHDFKNMPSIPDVAVMDSDHINGALRTINATAVSELGHVLKLHDR